MLARADRPHIGNPGAEDILSAWIDDALAGKSSPFAFNCQEIPCIAFPNLAKLASLLVE